VYINCWWFNKNIDKQQLELLEVRVAASFFGSYWSSWLDGWANLLNSPGEFCHCSASLYAFLRNLLNNLKTIDINLNNSENCTVANRDTLPGLIWVTLVRKVQKSNQLQTRWVNCCHIARDLHDPSWLNSMEPEVELCHNYQAFGGTIVFIVNNRLIGWSLGTSHWSDRAYELPSISLQVELGFAAQITTTKPGSLE